MKPCILIVDDDEELLSLLEVKLQSEGFKVQVTNDSSNALEDIRKILPDLVILDVNMPDINGMEVCKTIRSNPKTIDLPIIMLTACNDEVDRVLGLEFGADDYVTKPFNSRELILRIKNVLKRTNTSSFLDTEILEFGHLWIDQAKHEVKVKGETIPLTLTEFKLLARLVETPGKVQSRSVLLDEIWEYGDDVLSRTIDTHIQRLRSKLNEAGQYIKTIRGIGYQFNHQKAS